MVHKTTEKMSLFLSLSFYFVSELYKSFMTWLAHHPHSSVAATGLVGWEGPQNSHTQTIKLTDSQNMPHGVKKNTKY